MTLNMTWRRAVKAAWLALLAFVVTGSLLPASSSVMRAVAFLHINDKALHFAAYLMLAALPALALSTRRRGMAAGLAMFLLSLVLEALQLWVPGRAVELADLLANGAGVGCGAIVALQLRASITFL